MKLPRHECGLSIEHNAHTNVYESIEDYYDPDNWTDESARQRSISLGDVWEIRWYPDTPVGFFVVSAPTLDEAVSYALEVESKNE